MESFEGWDGESNPTAESAAIDELDRLAALEESAWMNQGLYNAPTSIKIVVPVVSVVALTIMWLIFRDYGESFAGLAVMGVATAAFVFGVVSLERKYSGARPKSFLPPLWLFKKQWLGLLLLSLPFAFFTPQFFSSVENGDPWWMFVLLVSGVLLVSVLWALALARFGILERVNPTKGTD